MLPNRIAAMAGRAKIAEVSDKKTVTFNARIRSLLAKPTPVMACATGLTGSTQPLAFR
jgi:hypothetical protein